MSNSFVQRLLSTEASCSPLALRLPAGVIFTAHGAQKLFGWFGGYGLEGTGQWMGSIGLSPGYLMALLAGRRRARGLQLASVDSRRWTKELLMMMFLVAL